MTCVSPSKSVRALLFSIILIFVAGSPCQAITLDSGNSTTGIFTATEPLQQQDPRAALRRFAEERFRQGRWQEAADYATQLLVLEPGDAGAHGIAGAIAALTGSREAARKHLAAIASDASADFYSALIRAVLAAQNGSYAEAETQLAAARRQKAAHPVVVYYQGSLDLARDRLSDAQQNFEQVVAEHAAFAPALAGLGQVFLRRKDMDAAAAYYRRAVESQPEVMLYRRQLIDIYRAAGQAEAAGREVKAALYHTPGVRQRYLAQGMQLLTTGAYDPAITLMDRLIANYRRIPQAHYIKAAAEELRAFIGARWGFPQDHHYAGMCYLALGDIDQAYLHFRTVIEINPDMGKSFVPMTVIEQIRGNYDRALEGLRLARMHGEPPPLVDYLFAHVHLSKGSFSEYRTDIAQAAALVPGLRPEAAQGIPVGGDTTAFGIDRNLMVLFFLNGWYGKAIDLGDKLVQENRYDRFALYYLALAYAAQGKTTQAIAAYDRLVDLEPNLYSAYMGIGKLRLQSGDLGRAAAAFDRVIAIRPNFAPAYLARGDLLVRRQEMTAAVAAYQKAMAAEPDDPAAYQRLAMIFVDRPEKRAEALKLALRAEDLSPEDPVAQGVVGWAYVQLDEIEKGIGKLKDAARKAPGDPLIHYHLGVAYHKQDKPDAAKQELQRALAISKSFKGASEAQQLLDTLKQ